MYAYYKLNVRTIGEKKLFRTVLGGIIRSFRMKRENGKKILRQCQENVPAVD